MRASLLAWMLVTLAAPAAAIEAHRMHCAYPDGSAQELVIDGAMEFRGAVAYQVGEEIFLTSRACLFNVGPSKATPESSDDLGHVVITCEGIEGTPVYLAHASHARVRRGVWQWREAATGDRYLATIPCTASPR